MKKIIVKSAAALVIAGVFIYLLSTRGGQAHPRQMQSRNLASTASVLRIGYQKGGAANLLRVRGDLEKRLAPQGVRVEWLNFPAGPQMLEAIGVGSADIGATGDAPPIFAQAAGLPIVYVANVPPGAPDARAILVPHDSPIRDVRGLRGKRIAVQKGSGTHNFLVQALAKARVPYDSVHIAYLAPTEARAALDSGSVDAWAIWDPFLAVAQKTTQARVLINGAGIVSAGGFYLASRDFATTQPNLIRTFLEEVDKTSIWIAKHPHEGAAQMAPAIGIDAPTLEITLRRSQTGEPAGFRPISREIVAQQQQVADIFYQIKLLPRRVDVAGGMLTHEQSAALTPRRQTNVSKVQVSIPQPTR